MDSTYKMNRFNLPLFDIVGINCEQRTFFVAFCFLKGERYEDFKQTLARLVNVYNFWITHPLETVITDQCTGLMAVISQHFPNTTHLTCFWHHRENLKTNYRKFFPITTDNNPPVQTDKEWLAFKAAWFHCLNANTKREYDLRQAELINIYAYSAPESLKYLTNNW